MHTTQFPTMHCPKQVDENVLGHIYRTHSRTTLLKKSLFLTISTGITLTLVMITLPLFQTSPTNEQLLDSTLASLETLEQLSQDDVYLNHNISIPGSSHLYM